MVVAATPLLETNAKPAPGNAKERELMPRMQRSTGACKITTKLQSGRTVLADLRQEGASKAMFPTLGVSDWLEAVLVNTSGGYTGGDRFCFEYEGEANTKAVLTSQACEKNYRSLGEFATVDINLSLDKGASVMWCPQETILFNDSRVARTITVEMNHDAHLIILEPILFGRSASKESFVSGAITDQWRVWVDGKLAHAEAMSLNADLTRPITRLAVLGDNTAMATLLMINPPASIEPPSIATLNNSIRGAEVAASLWSVEGTKKFVVRAVARDGYTLRAAIDAIYSTLELECPLPRVWRV